MENYDHAGGSFFRDHRVLLFHLYLEVGGQGGLQMTICKLYAKNRDPLPARFTVETRLVGL